MEKRRACWRVTEMLMAIAMVEMAHERETVKAMVNVKAIEMAMG